MYRVWNYVTNYSMLLVLGAAIALVWANLDAHSYHAFVDTILIKDFPVGYAHLGEDGQMHRTLTVHYLINDVLMAFFFLIAGKEVWEAIILKKGALRGGRALTPVFATAGGMIGPVAVYLGLAAILGSDVYDAAAHGWAIPTATDIAFSYIVGRIVFGAGHPAVRFLLLLAIADDAAGLVILTVFYPTGALAPEWLLLSVGAAMAAYLLFCWLPTRLDHGNMLRPASTWVRKHLSIWPYVAAGALSWYGFQEAGLHPALGLLPVIPAIPHADRSFGVFSEAEIYLTDELNRIVHLLKVPVEVILFFFGLANAGVAFSSIAEPTWLVLAGLLVGKPVGIMLFGWLAAIPLGFGLPSGMRLVDLAVIGCVAAIGFTVSLFIAGVAFDPGPVQDAAKMGALLSLAAAPLAILFGRIARIERQPGRVRPR
jgi:NhaA family Na+:H+ antiporter